MLKLYTYRIPFKTPFKIAEDSFTDREGLILVFEHKGITAYGEIAPLPGFSKFTLNEIILIVQLNRETLEAALIQDEFDQFIYVLNQIHDIPSLKFGLDTLAHDYKAKKAGLPLSEYLFGDTCDKKVPVNATIGITDLESTLKKAEQFSMDGFNTFKLKVGIDFKKEFEILTSLRSTFPDKNIRIDANQSWNYTEAVKNLTQCDHLNIEYCEEPLLDTETHRLSDLKQKININLAADESFRNKADAERLLKQNAVDALILKPMMFGSFSEINVTKQLAESHYTSIVLTTSLESKIGRTVTAILATGWGTKRYAHGLSTGSLLKYDLGTNQEIYSGFFHIPQKPGLGIDLNYKYLKEII